MKEIAAANDVSEAQEEPKASSHHNKNGVSGTVLPPITSEGVVQRKVGSQNIDLQVHIKPNTEVI